MARFLNSIVKKQQKKEDAIGQPCLTPLKGIKVRQKQSDGQAPGIDPHFIAATTVIGDKVKGKDNKEVGKIEEVMLDLTGGSITYLVLSTGGFFGIGDKFIAVPLEQLTYDMEERVFFMELTRKEVKKARGFDKENWPQQAEWPIKV